MEEKYKHEFLLEIIQKISAFADDQAADQVPALIENIREISEFILYGEKFSKPEYFDAVKEQQLLEKLIVISQDCDIKINE